MVLSQVFQLNVTTIPAPLHRAWLLNDATFYSSSLGRIPWVPEVSRGPLRDLPAEGRRPTNERRRREKTSGEERFDLLLSLNFDHSYRITFKPITANISYCDHMHQHVKIRQI